MFNAYKDIFNQRGAAYHAAMLKWPQARQMEFAHILTQAEIGDGDALCDIPSGGGYLAGFVEKRAFLTCVETSQSFFDQCPSRPRVRTVLAALHDTQLPSASFDQVVCLAGLHHVQQKSLLFGEVARLLKPGGRFCLADANEGSPVARFLDSFVNAHSSMGHQGEYLRDSMLRDLKASGFDIVFDQRIPYTWNFGTVQDMVEFCQLLFGIDKAKTEDVEYGIREGVGYARCGDIVRMNWELRFITGVKQ